jgi:hypothetical protein
LQQNFSGCFAALKQSEGANCVSEGNLVPDVRGLPFHLQIKSINEKEEKTNGEVGLQPHAQEHVVQHFSHQLHLVPHPANRFKKECDAALARHTQPHQIKLKPTTPLFWDIISRTSQRGLLK